MKKLLTVLFACMAVNAYSQQVAQGTYGLPVSMETKQSVKVYTGERLKRIEILSPYLGKKAASRLYRKIVRQLEGNAAYRRLNGAKSQVLFMRGGNINRNVMVAKIKFGYGYRVALAYDTYY